MSKNNKINSIKKRAEFVQTAFKDPEEGAKILRSLANSLSNTKTTNDTVFALSRILHVSERTIERDLTREII